MLRITKQILDLSKLNYVDNPSIPELTPKTLIPTMIFLFGAISGLIILKSRN